MLSGKLQIYLFGHFRVYTASGLEISIDGLGEKSKGMLAILATRPNQPIARTYLQDKLWSDRGEQQGRNSLKQALRQIKALFQAHGYPEVIRTNGGPIYLDGDQTWIDYHDGHPDKNIDCSNAEFLEGIDIKDSQFNIWLSSMRAHEHAAPLPKAQAEHSLPVTNRAQIGILPINFGEGDSKAQLLGNTLIDRVTNAVSFFDLHTFHDFRQCDVVGGRGCDFLLSAQAISLGSEISLSISMLQTADNQRLWGHQFSLDMSGLTSDRLAQIAIQISDMVLHSIDKSSFRYESGEPNASKLIMEGIDRLFRPSTPSVREAVAAFREACQHSMKSSFLAWQAYSSAHVLELDPTADRSVVLEETEELAAHALEIDPFNPLTRILLTHVYAFVYRDLERADGLIGPLAQSPPDTPLYYYFLGCLRSYQQDFKSARDAALRARLLGRHSPYAHMFSSLATMTSNLSGDFPTAIRMGEEALALQPKQVPGFGPTMRYLASAYAQNGQMQNAIHIYKNMRSHTPDFSAERLLDPSFPVPTHHARRMLRNSFLEIEQRLH